MKPHKLETLRNQYGLKKNEILWKKIGFEELVEELENRTNMKIIISGPSRIPNVAYDLIGGKLEKCVKIEYSLITLTLDEKNYNLDLIKIDEIIEVSHALGDPSMNLNTYKFLDKEGQPKDLIGKNHFAAYWIGYQNGTLPQQATFLKTIGQQNERKQTPLWRK